MGAHAEVAAGQWRRFGLLTNPVTRIFDDGSVNCLSASIFIRRIVDETTRLIVVKF